jgi:uncharacterized protein YdaU (DUF1376 family)
MRRRKSVSADTKVDVYLPLYVRDFLTSTIGWTACERGHYLTLLMLQWDRDGLPADLDSLDRLSPGVGDVWVMLQDKFPVEADGQRRNARLEEHRDRAVELRRKRSEAGKAAAAARAGSSNRSSNVEQTFINRSSIDNHPPSPSPSTSNTGISPSGEINQPAAPVVATSDPPKRRKRSQLHNAVQWSSDDGWTGITANDRMAWADAYPAVVLDIELIRASEWLKANPTRAKKSNWRRFLVSWLTRSQDKGGTNRSAGKTPEDLARKQSLERKAREFAEYRPAPYRTPKEALALAERLKLKEEDL